MSAIDRPAGLLDDFYRPFGSLFSQGFPTRLLSDSETWMPAVDIKRENGAFLIEMEVPGFAPDQIDVEAHDNVLTIQGARESESDKSEGDFIRRERRYGKFVRRFNLPAGVASDDINAQVKEGVLHIRIPDGEAATPKKIAVE
jgi:HSP20 family protein